MYNHRKNLAELEDKALIYTGYDYTDNDPHGLAEQFFQFCQQNLSEQNGEYQIQPARFIYLNEASVNAKATKRYGYYAVCMHMGTLITLHKFFTERGQLFEEPVLTEFLPIDGKLDISLELLMYQLATQFTYYHELSHLIQYSPLEGKGNINAGDVIETEEAYAVNAEEGDPFDLEKHVKEFDADLYGGHYICLHLIDYWKKLDIEIRTPASLELLLSLGTGAVFTYFIFLLRKYPAMYYDVSDHPHPLIRILYIIDLFIQTAQKNMPDGLQIKSEDILNRAFRLTQAMFTFNGGEDLVKKYSDVFMQEKEKIEAYVNKVLIAESQKLPFLVLQRIAAQEQTN